MLSPVNLINHYEPNLLSSKIIFEDAYSLSITEFVKLMHNKYRNSEHGKIYKRGMEIFKRLFLI